MYTVAVCLFIICSLVCVVNAVSLSYYVYYINKVTVMGITLQSCWEFFQVVTPNA